MRKEANRGFQPFLQSQDTIKAEQKMQSVFSSIDSSVMEDSDSSQSSSSDLMEDGSSFSSSNGPLYHLSDLMAQLPIKRGLSKYYQGKSESFASLESVGSLEDLAKRENPYRKRMKLNKLYSPKAIISKKTSSYSRGCCSSSSPLARNTTNFRSSCRLHHF